MGTTSHPAPAPEEREARLARMVAECGAFACDGPHGLQEGLTTREYAAIQVLAGLWAGRGVAGLWAGRGVEVRPGESDQAVYDRMALAAVRSVDALLLALQRPFGEA